MGMTEKEAKWVIDDAMIDTGSNVMSLVGLSLIPEIAVESYEPQTYFFESTRHVLL